MGDLPQLFQKTETTYILLKASIKPFHYSNSSIILASFISILDVEIIIEGKIII